MPYTLAFTNEPVPGIPPPPAAGSEEQRRPVDLPPDRHEHFGTREAALDRASELLPAPPWFNLRLFGPDGRHIADQAALERLLAGGKTAEVPRIR
ncbi:hypothetical protein [Lichenicoccus sp.]|uniref:hypothetical protein n=1 Tax=Lichenicoccus sp. TaxID=2781899 RepID=UPI003D109D99